MAYGMFGGFIFGFLGTAMPRMLAAKPLRVIAVLPLVLVHVAMVASFAATKLFLGDVLFLVLLGGVRRLHVDPRETTEGHAAARVYARRPGVSICRSPRSSRMSRD